MKNILRGVVFLAFFFTPILLPTEENMAQGFFIFALVVGAVTLLMWRLDMLDLPKKYRYGKEEKE